MYLSIWLGIVMSTSQSGCSVLRRPQPDPLLGMQVRRATTVQDPSRVRARPSAPLVQNPTIDLPNVPPPGVRTRYSSVHTDDMVIAFTFDDGPHPVNTPKLLDELRARNIKGTFFLVGELAKRYPNLVRRMVEEGHEIGNHTYTHPILTKCSDEKVRSELQRSADAVREACGVTPRVMRPPGGGTNKRLESLWFNEFGLTTILWSVDPFDWKRPGVSVVQNRLINGAHKGAILLTHDIHAPTITALPKVFDELLARGYKFVTVSQLLNLDQPSAPVGVTSPPVLQPLPAAVPVTVGVAPSP